MAKPSIVLSAVRAIGEPSATGPYASSNNPVAPAAAQAARRRTSQTVAAMSRSDSASSQPPSIHWNGQNRLAGW
jgi:hypothetical protein